MGVSVSFPLVLSSGDVDVHPGHGWTDSSEPLHDARGQPCPSFGSTSYSLGRWFLGSGSRGEARLGVHTLSCPVIVGSTTS